MRRWAELVRTLDHEGAVREDVITPFRAALNELFATRKICTASRSRPTFRGGRCVLGNAVRSRS
ncbi:MAG: hypothetical protein MZV63_36195 [Marinilabiliales bacterium]|nr:hypothetical protein [Marinilabiliales bacterium]